MSAAGEGKAGTGCMAGMATSLADCAGLDSAAAEGTAGTAEVVWRRAGGATFPPGILGFAEAAADGMPLATPEAAGRTGLCALSSACAEPEPAGGI